MRLSDAQIELYSRQIILRELGGTGQSRLLDARCLVHGSGAAAEMALSYLAGAGVGAIDLLPGCAGAPESLPLAALATRCPDTVVQTIAGVPAVPLDQYDIALTFRCAAEHSDLDELSLGRVRVGCVAVHTAGDGSITVLLVPQEAGCLVCVVAPDSSARASSDGGRMPGHVGLAAAGALAALACCRWLSGVGGDSAARVLRLAAGSALWLEGVADHRAPPCPRGCPPMAERL